MAVEGWYETYYHDDTTGDDVWENEFDFSTPVTEDKTLYPKWVVGCEVTFVLDTNMPTGGQYYQYVAPGNYADWPQDVEEYYDEESQQGYKVNAWYGFYDPNDMEFTDPVNLASTPITEDTILYGEWVVDPDYPIPTITVTFDTQNVPHGEDADAPIEVEYPVGAWIEEPYPVPENAGYYLANWCYDSELTTPVDDWGSERANYVDVTYYAQWEEEQEP